MASNINETTGTDDNIDPAVQQSAVNNTANINETTGTADDDGGTQPTGPTPSNNNSSPYNTTNTNQSSVSTNGTTGGTDNASQGATGSPTSNANTFSANSSKPGKRQKNPLGYLASYTYQLSLYMITPDAYDLFISSGRKNVEIFNNQQDGGAYLIAQSGGINNTTNKRAPGFQFDYGIDDLTFDVITSAKADGSNINTTIFKFKITEPYGFNFVTKLRNSNNALGSYIRALGRDWPEAPDRQFFILGIKFYGYDDAGNIVTGKEIYDGQPLDSNASGNGSLFQTFYDVLLTNVHFRIDGKATVYDIEATSIAPKQALSVTKGLLDSNIEITAGTVGEAIQKLFDRLNEQDNNKVKNKTQTYANNWELEGYNNAKTRLFTASCVTKEDSDKFRWPSSGALNTQQVNDATALLKSQPKKTQYKFIFKQGTPIIQAINDIVKQSTFLRDALTTVYTQALEPTEKGQASNNPNTNKNIEWFNISTKISNAKWDSKINDWVITTTFILQTYQTPVIDSAYANAPTKYYGPHKRYDYWYTGENKEILNYTQQLDQNFFNVVLGDSQTNSPPAGATGGGNATDGPTNVTKKIGQYTGQPRLGELGKSLEAQNNFVTNLYDPNAYAKATIGVLGDPDFLIQDQSPSESLNIYAPFYGSDGFTINASGGQVFVEIDFKEAIDYNYNNGLLTINDSILFWKYPTSLSKIVKGVSYMLITVHNSFSNGMFKQTLDCIINDFGAAQDSDQRTDNTATQNSGPDKGNNNNTTSGQGLKPVNPTSQTSSAQVNTSGNNPTTQPTSTVNPQTKVQDDDNTSTTTVTITESGGGSTTRYANGAVVISSA